MTIGSLLMIAAIVYGLGWAHNRRALLRQLPKAKHRHDRVVITAQTVPPVRSKKREAARLPMPLDEEDLAELDGMFGDAGSRPEDYIR